MTRAEWVSILAQARAEVISSLQSAVEAAQPVELTCPPTHGVLLATLEESVEGLLFHPGEILVTTCEARVGDALGYAVILGGDMAKARACAVLDAVLQGNRPERRDILEALLEERRWLAARHQAETEMVQATRVRFDTLNPQR